MAVSAYGGDLEAIVGRDGSAYRRRHGNMGQLWVPPVSALPAFRVSGNGAGLHLQFHRSLLVDVSVRAGIGVAPSSGRAWGPMIVFEIIEALATWALRGLLAYLAWRFVQWSLFHALGIAV